MSRSPTDQDTSGSSDAYKNGLRDIGAMVRQGLSWSGNERNCVFLNTGSQRFANASAASGLDFSDDGRGAATVDWDHDGRVDLWLTNRTAPRVRFLRNQVAENHNFLALRLQGTECNRDAIGARVEVVVENPKSEVEAPAKASHPKSIKTLRAGEGFLSQSSKWLHFGLAGNQQVDHILVRWPDGATEEFRDVQANQHYRVVQGSGTATPWTPPRERPQLQASPPKPAPAIAAVHNIITLPVPVPSLQYKQFDGQPKLLREGKQGPLLLTLWASWCPPCLAELKELTDRSEEIRSHGLDVVALSVDELPGVAEGNVKAAEKLVSQMGLPFDSGLATPSLVDILQILNDWMYENHDPLPVPSSFLINGQGLLTAFYKGAVPVDRVLADAGHTNLMRQVLRPTAVRFPGQWMYPQQLPRFLLLPYELLDHGHLSECIPYIAQNRQFIERDADYPKLLALVGAGLRMAKRPRESVDHYRQAIQSKPDYWEAQNDLAWILATSRDGEVRDAKEAIRLAETVAEATTHSNATVLDTLASSYAADENYDRAVETARKAIQLARESKQPGLAEDIEQRLKLFEQNKPYIDP